jgi:hypothetical protein
MTKVIMIAVMAAGVAGARGLKPDPPYANVRVFIKWEASDAAIYGYRATWYASSLLANAGIELQWLKGAPEEVTDTGHDVIEITVVSEAPAEFNNPANRQALAFALPYGSGPKRITVFWDRVQDYIKRFKTRGPAIFGHVLAHEIGHVLEGTARHSGTGLMRAWWSEDDLAAITRDGLQFAEEDRHILRVRFTSPAGTRY